MQDHRNRPLALLGDSPVLETKTARQGDFLKFEAIAQALAEASVETISPLTMGIFGEWGTGKTSMMRLIRDVVETDYHDRAAGVWFNAWQYEKEEHLIVPLVATINKALEKKTWGEWLAEGARKMQNALRAIAYGFSIKGKIGVPLISEAEINLSPKNMIERYQDLTKDTVLSRSLYFDAFETLEECAQAQKIPRIVVFVDDLDRCFPDQAVALLENIKLVLCQPGFSFVLGVYEKVIHEFIRKKYEKDFNIDGTYYTDYLDKMVQLKVSVPRRRADEMSGYILSLIQEIELFAEYDPKDIEGRQRFLR